MSGFVKAFMRNVELHRRWGVGSGRMQDIRFSASCIISGSYCEPFDGVF